MASATDRRRKGPTASKSWILLPREHGAWGMLLTPFVAGVILGRHFSFSVVVGLAAALLAFIVREPLIVVARQRRVWRSLKPETAIAKQALAWQLPLLACCGLYLWLHLPRTPLLALAAVGAVMTTTAVLMAASNMGRSVALQLVGAFAVTSTALLGALVSTARLPDWSWQLWALMSLHSLIGVFTVHARLERRLERRTDRPAPLGRMAAALAAILAAAAAAAWALRLDACFAPLGFTAFVATFELSRLRRDSALDEPFANVGVRLLLLSLAHATLVVLALW